MQKPFRILISAYACEPNRGSEPGVGWNWVNEIAKRGHRVHVITRKNNKEKIESSSFNSSNITFHYYDLPVLISRYKKLIGVHIYYFLWQLGILRLAKKIILLNDIDAVHHLTFVSLRKPTFLSFLNKPFFYGPVGGGEEAPIELIRGLPFKYYLVELARILLNRLVKFNPLQVLSFYKARIIATTTKETFERIPNLYKCKAMQVSAIGVNSSNRTNNLQIDSSIKLLYVGQFKYWKGLSLTIQTLQTLHSKGCNATLTLVGEGPFKSEMKSLIGQLELDSLIQWIDWVGQNELEKIYKSHHFFMFPSLHDSGGMVVLEAMNYGLPVASLDLGGPGIIINNKCGVKVSVLNQSQSEIVYQLSQGIMDACKDQITYEAFSSNAIQRAKDFSWENVVAKFYSPLELMLLCDKESKSLEN